MSRKAEIHDLLLKKIYDTFHNYYQNKLDEVIAKNGELLNHPGCSTIRHNNTKYKATLSTMYAKALNLHSSLHDELDEVITLHKEITVERRNLSFKIKRLFNQEDNIEQLMAMLPEVLSHLIAVRDFRPKYPEKVEAFKKTEAYAWMESTVKQRLMLNSLLE